MSYVIALVPTVGLGLLFFFVIKYMLEGDRAERRAHAIWESEQRRAAEKEAGTTPPAE
ncbi:MULTISPECIES: hypothetical protein [unclassified Janibacter]|uniref:hypothetical protein n=1 Tax=unclassified Janibacter TaxID=2649294 RepID=UPI003D07DADD